MYTADYNDWVPTHRVDNAPAGSWRGGFWFGKLSLGGYLNFYASKEGNWLDKCWRGTVFECPSSKNDIRDSFDPTRYSTWIDYGFNNNEEGLGLGVSSDYIKPFLKVHMISTDTLVIADTGPYDGSEYGSFWLAPLRWSWFGLAASRWHSNGFNAVTLSGNTEYFKYSSVYTQKTQPIEPRITRKKD